MVMKAESFPAVLFGSASHKIHTPLLCLLDAADTRVDIDRMPDGELQVRIASSVRGRRVYVVQTLGRPVGERLLELGLLADAARRAGAFSVTAVVPYLGYARQDRRGGEGEPLGGALVARLLSACAIDRVVTVDLHTAALEGFFGVPVEHLTAEPLLARTLEPLVGTDSVVVSPDLGAVKLARRYAQRLELPLAVVHKTRSGPSEVAAERLVGEVRGLRPVIVDDMISTGGTIAAARGAVLAAGARPDILVAATHGVFAPGWRSVLGHPDIHHILVTDSLESPDETDDPRLGRVPLAPLLADAIRLLHADAPLADLLART